MSTNGTNSTIPSIECEAAEEAAKFIARTNPQLAQDFIAHMRKRGDERRAEHRVRAAGGRIRQGYLHWAAWMEDAVSAPLAAPAPVIVLKDPVEQAIFGGRLAIQPDDEVHLDASTMAEIEKQQAEEKAKREERQRFLYTLSSEATMKLSSFDSTKGLSEMVGAPEIVEFEGKKAIFVYSYTAPRYGRKIRHDYRANGVPVTTKHPDMVMGEDGQRLIRSFETTDGAIFYVKVLAYKDGMYFRGYFNVEGNNSDEEKLTRYFQIINGKMTTITALEYQRLENMRSAGLDPADPKWSSQQQPSA